MLKSHANLQARKLLWVGRLTPMFFNMYAEDYSMDVRFKNIKI